MADEKRPPLGGGKPGEANPTTGTGDGSVAKPGKGGDGTKSTTDPAPAPKRQ